MIGADMVLDEPSAQLHCELYASIQSALKTRRPIIHHLNDDSSWLLQIPRPQNAIKRGSRIYFNIVIDPWLTGGQSDVVSWFSNQTHATPSATQSIAELEELISRVESLASAERTGVVLDDAVDKDTSEATSLIDAVAVSHEFTDHCHHGTLLEVHPDVPVFAFAEAAALISSWKHFRTVIPVNNVSATERFDWRSSSLLPLPDWIGICRLLQTKDQLNYHSALLITFNNRHGNAQSNRLALEAGKPAKVNTRSRQAAYHKTIRPNGDDESAEALIYTPHGLYFEDFKVVSRALPSISTLAFLHGLHNVRIGTLTGGVALQLNLGALNGLSAQRVLKASYWISTHDEVKKGGGLVSWFLERDSLTLEDAIAQERRTQQQRGADKADGELKDLMDSFDDTAFVHLGNGESRILE